MTSCLLRLQAEDLALEVAARRSKAAAAAAASAQATAQSGTGQRPQASDGIPAERATSAGPGPVSQHQHIEGASAAGPIEALARRALSTSHSQRHSFGAGLWWPAGSPGGKLGGRLV